MIILLAPQLGKDENKGQLKFNVFAVQQSRASVGLMATWPWTPLVFFYIIQTGNPFTLSQGSVVLWQTHSFGVLPFPFLLFSFGNNFSVFLFCSV